MRKFFSLVAMVAIVAISGCGANSVARNDTTSTTATYTASSDSPRVVEQPVFRGGSVTTVDDASFDSEIASYKGVALVDFGATWCGYCRKISPEIDRVAAENAGKIKVTKIDIDRSPNTANQFGVNSVPCCVLFVDGKEVDRARGYRSKEDLMQWIQSRLPAGEVSSN